MKTITCCSLNLWRDAAAVSLSTCFYCSKGPNIQRQRRLSCRDGDGMNLCELDVVKDTHQLAILNIYAHEGSVIGYYHNYDIGT